MQIVNFTSKTPVVEGSLYGQNIIIIGAKRDSNSRTVRFVFGSIIDDISLIGANAFLHFEGVAPFTIAQNVQAVEDKITIDYLIPQAMTETAGDKKASIQFVKTDSVIWATTDMVFRILERTDTSTEIPASELPDLLTQVQTEATLASNKAAEAQASAGEAAGSAGTAVTQAQAASINKDATDTNKTATDAAKAAAEQAKVDAEAAEAAAQQLVQQAQSLLSNEPRQFLVATLAQRDALTDLRQCDRCDVVETLATYIYDKNNIDGDETNPEWILTSWWDALKSVAWDIIAGKPTFATVATTGSYVDLLNKPNRYESFITLTDGNWNYSLSDKAILTIAADTAINITNVYNGAVGIIKVYGAALTLPANSKKSVDFDYMTIDAGQHYEYSWIYDGTNFCWNRSVQG